MRIFTKEKIYKGLDSISAHSIYWDSEKRSISIDLIIQMLGFEPYLSDYGYFENVKKLYTNLKQIEGLCLIREIVSSNHNEYLNILFERNGAIGELRCKKIAWFNSHLCAFDILVVGGISKELYKDDVFKTSILNSDYERKVHSYLFLSLFQRLLITDVQNFNNPNEVVMPIENYCNVSQQKFQQKNERINALREIKGFTLKGIDGNVRIALDYSHKSIRYTTNISDTTFRWNREGVKEEYGNLYTYQCNKYFCNLDEMLCSIEEIKKQFDILNKTNIGFFSYFELGNTKGMEIDVLQEKLSIIFDVEKKYIYC